MTPGVLEELEKIAAACDFSGVVSISRGGAPLLELCRGFADRRHRVPNSLDTQFGVASVTKGLTALTTVALIEAGELTVAYLLVLRVTSIRAFSTLSFLIPGRVLGRS